MLDSPEIKPTVLVSAPHIIYTAQRFLGRIEREVMKMNNTKSSVPQIRVFTVVPLIASREFRNF